MRHPIRLGLLLPLLTVAVSPAWGHFTMLLPERHSVKKDETVSFAYQFGHPFEHQLFDAPAPRELFVLTPDGKRIDLLEALEKHVLLSGAQGKQVTVYRFRFRPELRGDYTFFLRTQPIWMDEEKEFLEDTAKVVLHVQAQKGWDTRGDGFDLVPLTRPYGLLPGMVFQAVARTGSRPVDLLAEIERYNREPPKALPPDEFVTRTARTDSNGVVTCTLTEPGWWSVTVSRDGSPRKRDGKDHPLRQRQTFWLYVDPKVPAGPEN